MSPLRWSLPAFAAATAALALAGAASAAVTPFTARYTVNTTGDVAIVGNTVLTCPSAAGGCAAVLAGADGRNNDFTMTHVDIDGDPATFASSSADLSVPAGARVLFAGLYWGGRSGAGGGGAAAPNAGIRATVKLKVPGAGAYAPVTGAETGDVADSANAYQASADVTAQVTAAGSGTYTVADVQASTGSDAYGGWSLVVAYRDAAAPLRNLAVFDGFEVVRNQAGDQSKSVTVTGLFAPPAGAVKAKVGVIAYDGDRSSTGDTLTLNGSPVSDGLHPVNDVLNSTFADRGTRFTAKAPDHANSLGMDASVFAADGLVANGATSATIDLTTGGETYYPGVVTSVIDLYAPQLVVTKSATDVNGGALVAGDVLQYAVTVSNQGTDAASAVVLTDTAPTGTGVVPGSLAITAGDGTGALSDASGDDRGDAATGTIAARLGSGATAAAGGSLAAGASTTATFRVRLGASIPAGTSLVNTAQVAHTAATAGVALVASSNTVTTVVAAPAPVAAKTRLAISIVGPRELRAGATGTYRVVVRSLGPATARGVRLRIPIPAGLAVRSLPQGFRVSRGVIVGPAMTMPRGARRTIVLGLAAASTQRRSVALRASAAGASVTQVRSQTPVRVVPTPRPEPAVTG